MPTSSEAHPIGSRTPGGYSSRSKADCSNGGGDGDLDNTVTADSAETEEETAVLEIFRPSAISLILNFFTSGYLRSKIDYFLASLG